MKKAALDLTQNLWRHIASEDRRSDSHATLGSMRFPRMDEARRLIRASL
jgi:hypothetical protein